MGLLKRYWDLMMSKLEKYPKYKDSGIEWIGEIPEGWEINKIQYILHEKKKAHNIELNCGSISFGKVVYKDDEKIPHSTKRAYQVVKAGDFLINPLNLNYDLKSLRIALSDLDVVVSSGYIVLDTRKDINKRYLNYLLHRFDVAFMKTLGAGVRQTLSYNDIAKCELIEPPIDEQTKIANYLDQKTAQIDKAISLKEQMIERLKERRQILINDAVTKGLDKTVKMKDSGIEWIGEVPEGWEVLPGFRVYKENKTKNTGMIEDQVLSLSYGKIIIKAKEKLTGLVPESFETYQIVKPGDIIIRCMDLQNDQTSLRTAIAKDDGIITSAYLNLNVINSFNSEYLHYFLHMLDITKVLYKFGTGLRQNLSYYDFKRLPLLVPNQREQEAIVEYIKEKTQKIDGVILLQEKQIEKIKEYKATLIDSVVTGKILIKGETDAY